MLHAIVLVPLLLAATAPLDARHAAVLAAISRGRVDLSPLRERRAAAAAAQIELLGRVAGDDVVLVRMTTPPYCGVHECGILVLRLVPGMPRVLLDTDGSPVVTRADAVLPRITVLSHGTAPVSHEVTYAYRNDAYVDVKHGRWRTDTDEHKPNSVAVHFAPGASSAQLHGSVGTPDVWDDVYTFAAAKGQQLTVGGIRTQSRLKLTLSGTTGRVLDGFRAGAAFTLPATGTYQLSVASDTEFDNVRYTLMLAIR